ncbi:hypothetical protein BH09ACT5_BH09ACT5_13210 [soil metagenome]
MDLPLSPRVKAGGVAVLVLVGLGCAVLVSAFGDHGSSTVVAPPTATAAVPSGSVIYVHILGAVARPGLYELRDGDRAIDAVASAGGFLDTADQAQLNLARLLVDGEQIVVPVIGQTPPAAPGTSSNGLVNLNTADAAALDTLPRVGPAMAARIVEWREANGPFTAVEDLMSVSGIGDKTFEGLRDLVTL